MTSPRPRPFRVAALGVGLAVVGLALAGCSATNPITTEDQYSASDGVRFVLGDVRASNLLVLSAAEGDAGAVQGGLVNESSEDRSVTLAIGDEKTTVELGPKQTVLIGTGRGSEDGFAEVTFPRDRRPARRSRARDGLHARGGLDRRPGARARRHAARVRVRGALRVQLSRRQKGPSASAGGPFCVRPSAEAARDVVLRGLLARRGEDGRRLVDLHQAPPAARSRRG